jgi:hypothetical protein
LSTTIVRIVILSTVAGSWMTTSMRRLPSGSKLQLMERTSFSDGTARGAS